MIHALLLSLWILIDCPVCSVVTPSPSPTVTAPPTASASPVPSATPTQVAANCPIPVPALTNPQNPVSYGADPSGAVESHNAFQNAINAGDLDVPAGIYLLNNNMTFPNGRIMKCEPGAILKTTVNTAFTMWTLNNNSSGGVYGCQHWGPNYNVHPPVLGNFAERFYFHQSIGTGGTAGHVVWANDDFNGTGGYVAAIHVYASDANQPPPNNDQVSCSSFENSGHYGIQITSAKNTLVQHTTFTDANCCVEADDAGQQNTGNVLDDIISTFTYGTGWTQNFLTGGVSCSGAACNYSGNTVSNSTCGGTHSAQLMESANGGSQNNASYINDSASGACSVH